MDIQRDVSFRFGSYEILRHDILHEETQMFTKLQRFNVPRFTEALILSGVR